jgi:hypothetical protein
VRGCRKFLRRRKKDWWPSEPASRFANRSKKRAICRPEIGFLSCPNTGRGGPWVFEIGRPISRPPVDVGDGGSHGVRASQRLRGAEAARDDLSAIGDFPVPIAGRTVRRNAIAIWTCLSHDSPGGSTVGLSATGARGVDPRAVCSFDHLGRAPLFGPGRRRICSDGCSAESASHASRSTMCERVRN